MTTWDKWMKPRRDHIKRLQGEETEEPPTVTQKLVDKSEYKQRKN